MASLALSPYILKAISSPPTLTPEDLTEAIRLIVAGYIYEVQAASFLTAIKMQGIDHQPDFVTACALAIREKSSLIDPTLVDANGYVDIVGTGGDGQNTFNVSTSAAIVAAGMGLKVCKHGGKASTSKSGAGDLLTHLGVKDLSSVNSFTVPNIVRESNFCFLFAPSFHPAMKIVSPLRVRMGIPTIFNVMGPLLNPAPIKARILGVYAESLGEVYAQAIYKMDKLYSRKSSTLVVWGTEGLDEISIAGTTKFWKIDPDTGKLETGYLHPSDFGIQTHCLSEAQSGTPEENAKLLKQILSGKFELGDPIFDFIILNAAALAVVEGTASDWKDGVKKAVEAIKSGSAKKALDDFLSATDKIQEARDSTPVVNITRT